MKKVAFTIVILISNYFFSQKIISQEIYEEKIKTFPWWGDTKYFIKEIAKEKSPLTGK